MRPSRRQEFVKTYYSRLSIAAVFCSVITLLLLWGWSSVHVKTAEVEFDGHVANAYAQLQDRLNSAKTVVSSLSGWYHSQLSVDANQLSVFANEVLVGNAHIHSIQFMKHVALVDSPAFIAAKHDDGYATFDIWQKTSEGQRQPVASRANYFPVTFVEPLSPVTARMLGYDLASLPDMSAAIYQSIQRGQVSVSRPLEVLPGQRGFYLFKAVYKGKVMPDTPQQRLAQVDGAFAATMLADSLLPDVLRHIDDQNTAVSLRHSSYTSAVPESLVFSYVPSFSGQDMANALPVFDLSIDMGSVDLPFVLSFRRYMTVGDFSAIVPLGILLACFIIIMLLRSLLKRDLQHDIESEISQDALFREKELAEVTIHSIADGVITTDVQNRVEYMNQVAEKLTGKEKEQALGRPLGQVLRVINEETGWPEENIFDREFMSGDADGVCANLTITGSDGERYAIKCSAAKMYDREQQPIGSVIVFRDVSKELEMARRMSHQARHDELTGLYNRREFETHLRRSLESRKPGERGDVLCYFDLDQFKVVNDTCGHVAGDELLRQITQLMHENIRESDVIARLGGDEFGVIFSNCSIDKAMDIASLLHNKIREFRFVWEGKTFDVGASMGLVQISSEIGSMHEVMSAADSACYVAKDSGRNRIYAHTIDDHELLNRQGEMNWVHKIHEAFEKGHFRLYRQAVAPLTEEAGPMHYEILVRMRDAQGNLVMPMAFIPAAERYNLMPELDRWVVRHTLARMSKERDDNVVYNINLSGKSINEEGFGDFLVAELEGSGVAPSRVCFEITETAAIVNLFSAKAFILRLKKIGCSFALDDFGSGLSSFSYLKNLPVDYLKIDGGFVKDMIEDPVDLAMVECIAQVGRVMNIKTIAEFVESKAIADELTRLGVDYAQGYHIAHPEEWQYSPLSEALETA